MRIPNGVRTRVTAVKGRCPRPLDDGDLQHVSVDRNAVGDRQSIWDRFPGLKSGPTLLIYRVVGDYVWVIDVPMAEFEELVSAALDTIPESLANLMDNVVVMVEEEKPGQPRLLGLYHGVPLTSRGNNYAGHLPDRISIYRRPILRMCSTPEAVVNQVRVTVVHEIAHHFGISDERLHELGAY